MENWLVLFRIYDFGKNLDSLLSDPRKYFFLLLPIKIWASLLENRLFAYD